MNNFVKQKSQSLISVLCALVLVFSVTVFSPLVSAKDLTDEELAALQLSEDLQFIFETASVKEDGKYILNETIIAKKFGIENVASIVALVKLANDEELTEQDLEGVPNPLGEELSTASWKSCMIDNVLDYTGIGFLTGGMMEMIDKKLWDKLALEIIKIVGKNAIKGGVVGLAASLAWFSFRCVGK
ncbi:hypothetical protein HNO89_002725 [Sporosarcina luteola]|nr:hypothetical protein [Sporosarcina luteola]